MRYRITHITRYSYEAPVVECLNEVRLTPRSLPQQQVFEAEVRVEPRPSWLDREKDYFGNDVTRFAVVEKHDRLTATASSVVEVRAEPAAPPPSKIAWEEAQRLLAEPADGPLLEASEFVFDSPLISTSRELAEYAHPSFRPGAPLAEALKDFSHRIYVDFRYEPKSTSIEMPLGDVLACRKGVCQDFAHVMIGGLRSLRLAARYISGYIRSGPRMQGAQASHAWVSAFVPGTGWLSFDPTNDLIPTDGHITLAWGRDYSDVTPVKGVTLGGGGQLVEVEVFVKAETPPVISAPVP